MNLKNFAILLLISLFHSASVLAGGILTNTNQSVHFIRNPARNASTEIDAAYTNPAGLAMLKDGWYFSFSNQTAFQTRTINSTAPVFLQNGGQNVKEFKGKTSAPIIPNLQAAYKKDHWVISTNIGIVGGGGKATFDDGLPSFEAAMGAATAVIQKAGYKANRYELQQHMKGSNIIIGVQLGGTYKINEMFSAYAGFRLNVVSNSYKGYLRRLKMNVTPSTSSEFSESMVYAQEILDAMAAKADDKTRQLLGLMSKASSDEGARLNCSQSGWGVAPIIGFNYNYENKLNIGIKYEFKTSLDVENDTKIDDTGMFGHGVNTAHDVPAMFSAGVSYKFIPSLTASIGYNHFFDSDAKMQDDKQKYAGATNEYLLGLEYQIDPVFLVSAGGQITRYGVENKYQRDLSFSCNSYSIGLGGAANITPTMRINIGYFWTSYSDYTKEPGGGISGLETQKDVFSRTNKVLSAGVDFRF